MRLSSARIWHAVRTNMHNCHMIKHVTPHQKMSNNLWNRDMHCMQLLMLYTQWKFRSKVCHTSLKHRFYYTAFLKLKAKNLNITGQKGGAFFRALVMNTLKRDEIWKRLQWAGEKRERKNLLALMVYLVSQKCFLMRKNK
jgi:hypothetical protein